MRSWVLVPAQYTGLKIDVIQFERKLEKLGYWARQTVQKNIV